MALLDASASKSAMAGRPTLFGLPMKQASLITVCCSIMRTSSLLPPSEAALLTAYATADFPELGLDSRALILASMRSPARAPADLHRADTVVVG